MFMFIDVLIYYGIEIHIHPMKLKNYIHIPIRLAKYNIK